MNYFHKLDGEDELRPLTETQFAAAAAAYDVDGVNGTHEVLYYPANLCVDQFLVIQPRGHRS